MRKDRRMGVIRFRAQLQRRGPAAAVVLDETQVAAVGEGAKRFPVVATVNGYTWRTSVARMGGEFLLGLSREVRDGAGVQAGDEAEVTIELDEAVRARGSSWRNVPAICGPVHRSRSLISRGLSRRDAPTHSACISSSQATNSLSVAPAGGGVP